MPTRRSRSIRRAKPDLVVCDLHMPNGGGIKVAKECGEQTRIVMLTVSEAERDLLDAVAAGAVGYLVKSTPPDELRAALCAPPQGEPVFSAPASPRSCSASSAGMSKARRRRSRCPTASARCCSTSPAATPTGRSASELFIAEKTVENHVRNILGKLHLNRKQELIRYALDHGIE